MNECWAKTLVKGGCGERSTPTSHKGASSRLELRHSRNLQPAQASSLVEVLLSFLEKVVLRWPAAHRTTKRVE